MGSGGAAAASFGGVAGLPLFQAAAANQRACPGRCSCPLRQTLCPKLSVPVTRGQHAILALACSHHPVTGFRLRASAAPAPAPALALPRARLVLKQSPRRPNPASRCAGCARFPPPLPRLSNLTQASSLGPRPAAVNWAWSFAGPNPVPRRFECTRFFAELGPYGLDTCDAST